jgi:hypothetical protein
LFSDNKFNKFNIITPIIIGTIKKGDKILEKNAIKSKIAGMTELKHILSSS